MMMLSTPIPRTGRAVERTGLSGDDDVFEMNEAFAPVVPAWRRELDVDSGTVNVTAAPSRSVIRSARRARA